MRSLKIKLCIMLTFAAAPLVAEETISAPQFGLRLTIPDGFVRFPEGVHGDIVFAFIRTSVRDEELPFVIGITRLPGTIGREALDPKGFTDKLPDVTIESEKWKMFDIAVIRAPQEREGTHI